jgi:hypothetical protein
MFRRRFRLVFLHVAARPEVRNPSNEIDLTHNETIPETNLKATSLQLRIYRAAMPRQACEDSAGCLEYISVSRRFRTYPQTMLATLATLAPR